MYVIIIYKLWDFYKEILTMNIKQIAPAFQIYASDILGDTDIRLMTAEEIGCFFLLLLNLWVNGGTLPNNIAQLQQIMHLKSHKKTKSVLNRLRNQFNSNRKTISSHYIDQQFQKQSHQRLKSKKGAATTNRKLHKIEPAGVSPGERIPYSISNINTTIQASLYQSYPRLLVLLIEHPSGTYSLQHHNNLSKLFALWLKILLIFLLLCPRRL